MEINADVWALLEAGQLEGVAVAGDEVREDGDPTLIDGPEGEATVAAGVHEGVEVVPWGPLEEGDE